MVLEYVRRVCVKCGKTFIQHINSKRDYCVACGAGYRVNVVGFDDEGKKETARLLLIGYRMELDFLQNVLEAFRANPNTPYFYCKECEVKR